MKSSLRSRHNSSAVVLDRLDIAFEHVVLIN
jgi:hypothetical protein